MKFSAKKSWGMSSLKTYLKDTSGNVAMIAGLAIIPIISVLGLAVDFQFVVTKKNTVQQLLDQTLIAAARDRQAGQDRGVVESRASDLFDSLLAANDPNIDCDPINAMFAEDSEDLFAFVDCRQPTTLSAIFGRDHFDFRVDSGSTFGVGEIDVAFVFDLSGSMSCPEDLQVGFDSSQCGSNNNGRSRMDALKDAANEAVDILLATNDRADSNVRIAMTGYSNALNAGQYFERVVDMPSNAERRPANLETSETVGNNIEDYIGQVQMEVGNERQFYDYESIFCPQGEINSSNCRGNYSDFAGRFYYDLGEHPTCVWARQGPQAATDLGPGNGAFMRAARPVWDFSNNTQHNDDANYVRKRDGQAEVLRNEGSWRQGSPDGIQTGSRSSTSGTFTTRGAINANDARCNLDLEPRPLTDDQRSLTDFIDAMEPNGGTAGHVGLSFGWYMLSPRWASVWPNESEPLEYDKPDSAKFLILMTDGEFNAEAPDVSESSVSQAADICRNIKDQTNITIFTVKLGTFESSNTIGTQSITEFCASSPDTTLNPTDGESLVDDFRSIAQQISDLRISS